jgi:hypothetical protein
MRAHGEAPGRRFAPRYQAVAGEAAGRAAAIEQRRAEAAREEAAKFFYDLRRGLRLARVAVANRIGTEATVIEALETGALDRLPPWPHTVRVVTAYTQLAHLDPRPVLHALHAAYSLHQRTLKQQTWAQRMMRRLGQWSSTLQEAREHRARTLTWAAGIVVPTVLLGSLMLTTGLQASQLRPLASVLGLEGAKQAEAIRRLEGLVWIDAADPRQRRADKLPGQTR